MKEEKKKRRGRGDCDWAYEEECRLTEGKEKEGDRRQKRDGSTEIMREFP